MYVCLSIFLFICLSVCLCLYICLPVGFCLCVVFLSVRLHVCLSASACLPVNLLVCLSGSACLSVSLLACLSICLSAFLSVSVCLSVSLPVLTTLPLSASLAPWLQGHISQGFKTWLARWAHETLDYITCCVGEEGGGRGGLPVYICLSFLLAANNCSTNLFSMSGFWFIQYSPIVLNWHIECRYSCVCLSLLVYVCPSSGQHTLPGRCGPTRDKCN